MQGYPLAAYDVRGVRYLDGFAKMGNNTCVPDLYCLYEHITGDECGVVNSSSL